MSEDKYRLREQEAVHMRARNKLRQQPPPVRMRNAKNSPRIHLHKHKAVQVIFGQELPDLVNLVVEIERRRGRLGAE
eukprot:scaffold24342_cov45-Isochrysis_galbana.AAC.1